MTAKHEIEQQELAFKELLGRVMRDPLSPIVAGVQELVKLMQEVDTAAQRTEALIAMNAKADQVDQHVKFLKTRLEETPPAVARAVQPSFGALQGHIDQGKAAIVALINESGARASEDMQAVRDKLWAVAASTIDSHRRLELALQSGNLTIDNAVQSTAAEVKATMQRIAGNLQEQLADQVRSRDMAFSRMQDIVSGHVVRMREDALVAGQQFDRQLSLLGTALAEMRTLVANQGHQLATTQHHDANTIQVVARAQQFARRAAIALASAALMLAAGLSGATWFLSGEIRALKLAHDKLTISTPIQSVPPTSREHNR